jgi:hypothetical protein
MMHAPFSPLQTHSICRDGVQPNRNSCVKDEDSSRSIELTERSPKKQKQGYPAEVTIQDAQSPTPPKIEQTSSASETTPTSSGSRRKNTRRRKTQIAEALPVLRHYEKKATSEIPSLEEQSDGRNDISTSGAAGNLDVQSGKVESTVAANQIPPNIVKQPQSCFDLLCSHVGFRGWRCYRPRTTSQAFCIYHVRESTPVSGICLYS